MKECTYLTCKRPSDSWENGKKSELEKMAKRRRQGEREKLNLFSFSHSLPLNLFYVCFPPFSIPRHYPLSTIHCPLLVHSGLKSFSLCRCKGSIDVHLGAFDILMLSHQQIKNATFFLFSVLLQRKIFGDLFLTMVFHRLQKRVKIFSETFITKHLYKRDSNTSKRTFIMYTYT